MAILDDKYKQATQASKMPNYNTQMGKIGTHNPSYISSTPTATSTTMGTAQPKGVGQKVGGFAKKSVIGLGRGVGGLAKGGLVASALMAAPKTIGEGFAKDTQEYYDRYGWDSSSDTDAGGLVKDFGVRTLGMVQDLGQNIIEGTFLDANPVPSDNNTPSYQKTTNENQNPVQDTTWQPKPIQIGNTEQSLLPNAPQATKFQGGLKADNPNYQAVLEQVGQVGQAMMDKQHQRPLGTDIYVPQRGWENEAHRKDLLQQATTVHKGANGLTAAQMRLAHELSNDDIKMEQERYLQQNNLNHQLQQEQLQQQAQNQRAILGETGQMARAIMGEQGQNARFNQNFGLDVAKFNQDAQNSQYELGLKGADLRSRLQSQALDDSVKAGHIDLYNQFINAKDDEQRDKILTQIAVLTGRGGGGQQSSGGSLKDNFIVMTDKDGNDKLVDLRTMQGGQSQGNPDWHKDPNILKGIEQVNEKGGTADEIRQAYIALGVPADQVDAVLAQRQG